MPYLKLYYCSGRTSSTICRIFVLQTVLDRNALCEICESTIGISQPSEELGNLRQTWMATQSWPFHAGLHKTATKA